MTRLLAPISAHEGIARGALVLALLVGWTLAATADVGPPDYALPAPWVPSAQVVDLTGIETDGGSGGQSIGSWATTKLATGDEVRVGFAWSDDEPRLPPASHEIAAEKLHRCVRVVVSTTGLELDPAALDPFLDARSTQLDEFLAGAPRDPCAGRPLTP